MLRELETMVIRERKNGTAFNDLYMDTAHFNYTDNVSTCTYCGSQTIQDAPTLKSVQIVDGIPVTMCERCITGKLEEIYGDKINVYTKPVIANTLKKVKGVVNLSASEIRKVGKASDVPLKVVAKYTNKLDRIHVGVNFVVKSVKDHSCKICKATINNKDSYFAVKKRSRKKGNPYMVKLCIPCYENSIEKAIEYNATVYNNAIIELTN